MSADVPSLLRAHKAAVAALGLALLLGGLVLAQDAWSEPVLERQAVEKGRWSEEASFAYRVPVTRNETLWPNGTVLPMGMPAYYRTVSDHVPLEFRWRAEGAEGLAEAEMRLLVRAESPGGRTYWEVSEPLARGLTRDPATGLHLEGVLLLDDLVGRVDAVMKTLPLSEGRVNWTVEATVTYALDSEAGPTAGRSEHRLPIHMSDPRFTLPGPEALQWRRPHADVETVTLARPAGWEGFLAALRAQALLLGGAALLGAALWAHRSDPDRGAGPRDVAFRREHERHRDWVTPLASPLDESRLPRPLLDVPTLEDLVHAAADARIRILLDRDRRVYYALAPTATWRYARHALQPPIRTPRPSLRPRPRPRR